MSFDVIGATVLYLVFRSKFVQGSDGQTGSSWTRGDERCGHKINDIFIGPVDLMYLVTYMESGMNV